MARSKSGRSVRDRFMDNLVIGDECWTLVLARNSTGYSTILGDCGRNIAGHRLSYEMFVGTIDPGLVLDHLCRNKACVNPSHLEPVTQKTNVLRGNSPSSIYAKRSVCSMGHALAYRRSDVLKEKARVCLVCRREWSAGYRSRQKSIGRPVTGYLSRCSSVAYWDIACPKGTNHA